MLKAQAVLGVQVGAGLQRVVVEVEREAPRMLYPASAWAGGPRDGVPARTRSESSVWRL